MNIIQKIGLSLLALIGIVALIFINMKKKATAAVNSAIVNSNRRKLATNEKRYYGKPYSTFDLIKRTDTLKEVNRKHYEFKNSAVEMVVTSDPDNTSEWGDVAAKHEVFFTKGFEDSPDSIDGNSAIKGIVNIKGGVVYKATVYAPTDYPLGLIIKDADGIQLFYIAYEGNYLNAGSLKN